MLDEFNHVSLATTYKIDESFNDDRFIRLRLRICHSGVNLNGSNFSIQSFEKAKPSLINACILGEVAYDEKRDDLDFVSHSMHVEPNQMKGHEDDYKLIYDENIIGIIPEDNNYSLEECNGKTYVCCDGIVFKGYSNYAEDIILRDQKVNLSMEVEVVSARYEKLDKTYHVDDYLYRGVTLLGQNHQPAMAGANGIIKQFSKDRFFELVDELQEELKKRKKGEVIMNEKLELLAKFGVEANTLDFNIEDFSIEEIETKLTKATDDSENFALQSGIINELCEKLSAEKVETDYGIESRYWYVDYDAAKSEIYFYDITDWKLYGCPYSLNGDVATIDMGCKNRKKFVIADYDEGEDNAFNFGVIETHIVNAKNDKYTTLQTEKDSLQAEFDNYKSQYSVANSDVEVLRQFKAERLDADHRSEVNEKLAEFADLETVEEFVALKNKAYDFESVEELEEKCFAIRGKNVKTQFAAKPKSTSIKIPIEQKPATTENKLYGDLFDEFGVR